MDDKKCKDDIAQKMATLEDSNQSHGSAVNSGKHEEKTAAPSTEKSEGDEIKAHCGMAGNKCAVVMAFSG